MRRLRALLLPAGLVFVGGVAYLFARPEPGVTVADLLDAGIDEHCERVQFTAEVRDRCQNTLPDGGLSPRYRSVRDVAYVCQNDAGPPVLIPRWFTRPALRNCYAVVSEDSVQILGPTFDDGGQAVLPEPGRCACRARGQVCRWTGMDGGLQLMGFNNTYEAAQAPFVGPGCVRRNCVEWDEGDGTGHSMPRECL